MNKEDKRIVVEAGTVIAVGEFSIGVLNNILTAIGSVTRKIAIGVDNESGLRWTALNVFFAYGASDITLPRTVQNTEALLYSARKSHNIFTTGAAGVFTYRMSDGNTLAVMFSVPYNKVSYRNWWNVKIYSGTTLADRNMWLELYRTNPFRANKWHHKDLGYGLRVEGFMTSAGEATLEIHIKQR